MATTRLYGPSGAPGVAGSVAQNTPGATAGVLPVKMVIATTTETVILNPSLNSPTAALVLSVPPNGPLEQRPFLVEPSGVIEPGVSSTVTLKLYSGSSTTVGNNVLLGSSGAITAFTAKTPFWVSAKLIYDSISGRMIGTIKFIVNNVIVAEVAVSNVVTGINNANNPVVSFVMSVTFGTANAANTIIVQDFPVNF